MTPTIYIPPTVSPVSPTVTVNPPVVVVDAGPGCWDSYVGFGTCAGGAIAKTGVGILLGIGETIADIFGL